MIEREMRGESNHDTGNICRFIYLLFIILIPSILLIYFVNLFCYSWASSTSSLQYTDYISGPSRRTTIPRISFIPGLARLRSSIQTDMLYMYIFGDDKNP